MFSAVPGYLILGEFDEVFLKSQNNPNYFVYFKDDLMAGLVSASQVRRYKKGVQGSWKDDLKRQAVATLANATTGKE